MGPFFTTATEAGTTDVSEGYAKSMGWPEAIAERPKKSITTPIPDWPEITASGAPNERSVMVAMLPPEASSSSQPFYQPYACRMTSTVRCVVPLREGALITRWP